ncbi:hypothetical protein Hanom_Chr10g00965821 [Helianthus anomalus]
MVCKIEIYVHPLDICIVYKLGKHIVKIMMTCTRKPKMFGITKQKTESDECVVAGNEKPLQILVIDFRFPINLSWLESTCLIT